MRKGLLGLFVTSALTAGATAQTLESLEDNAREAEKLLAELAQPDNTGWKKAEDRLMRVWSRSGSDTIDLMLKRGETAMEDGKYQDALAYFSAVTDHAPDFAEGWHSRASAFYMLNRPGPALADIEHALSLNPNHFGAMIGLGVIYEEMGQSEKALTIFKKAAEINPHNEAITESIKRINFNLGRATL